MMKQQNNQMKGLVWLLVAAVCVPCMLSWAATSSWRAPLGVAAVDTVVQQDGDDDLLPGTYPVGTLSRDSVDDSIEDLYVYIKAVGRTYGDSIVLRWAVESYPEWDRLNRTGYDVLRHTEGEGEFLLDTLATGIRPMSLADFRRCYPDTIDSLAFDEGARIVYNDTIDGWTDDLEDIDLMAGSAIELTANVENKIPAYLTVSATAIDVQGKPIPENRIKVEVSNVINASEDGKTPVVTPLKIRLTEGEPGSVALVDGLTFRIEAASGEEGAKSIVGQTINAYNHTLKARDIKVRLVGKIIVNKD